MIDPKVPVSKFRALRDRWLGAQETHNHAWVSLCDARDRASVPGSALRLSSAHDILDAKTALQHYRGLLGVLPGLEAKYAEVKKALEDEFYAAWLEVGFPAVLDPHAPDKGAGETSAQANLRARCEALVTVITRESWPIELGPTMLAALPDDLSLEDKFSRLAEIATKVVFPEHMPNQLADDLLLDVQDLLKAPTGKNLKETVGRLKLTVDNITAWQRHHKVEVST